MIRDHKTDANADGYSAADENTPANCQTTSCASIITFGTPETSTCKDAGRTCGTPYPAPHDAALVHVGGMTTGYGCGTEVKLARSDIDLDGAVSIIDLSKVATWFGNAINASTTDPRWEGDIDGDGTISILDLSKIATYFGRNVAATCPVPTPLVIDGTSVTVTLATADENAYLAFTGTAGQYLGLGMTPGGLHGFVSIVDPNLDLLQYGYGPIYSASGTDVDPVALPASGTYIVKVDPGVNTGSVTLTLSSDIVGTIGIDGSTVSPPIARPGQNARYTFNGTAGQYLGIGITPGGLGGYVSVLKPGLGLLAYGSMYSASWSDIDPPALPSSDTYTIKVDPGVTTGSVALTLSSDIIGAISVDGSTVSPPIARPGQNARYTFNGTAGQYLGIGITPGGLGGYVSVLKPDLGLLAYASMYSASWSDIDPPALPSWDTYTIKVDPGVTTGGVTLTLSSDIIGTITIDGPSVPVTILRAGRNARYTFTGTAGQILNVATAPGGLSGYVAVLKPDQNVLASGSMYSSSAHNFNAAPLPSTNTYTVKVDPGVTTGGVTLAISNVGQAPTATPTPTATPFAYAVFKGGLNELHDDSGQGSAGLYGGSLTVLGHIAFGNPLQLRVFDLNGGQTTGKELCFGTPIQTDWDYFGGAPGAQQSPYTLAGEGGFANGLLDCLAGHFLFGHSWYWWQNAANPTINPMQIWPPNNDPEWGNFGYTRCHALLLTLGGENLCGQFPE